MARSVGCKSVDCFIAVVLSKIPDFDADEHMSSLQQRGPVVAFKLKIDVPKEAIVKGTR